MTGAWRAFSGAACGALLVLLFHPISRPFIITPLLHWGTSQAYLHSKLLLENHPVLPVPKDLIESSLWMETGAKKLALKESFQPGDAEKLILVASNASRQDPDNSYWGQMEAVFLNFAGLHKEALKAWVRAGTCTRWDDQQTRKLKELQQGLADEAGGPAAWQYSAVYSLRNPDAAHAIEQFGREVIKESDIFSKRGLVLRFATLMNGKLLRDGCRSIKVGETGVHLVELSSYPNELGTIKSPRKLVLTRAAFSNNLRKAGMVEQSRQSTDAFDGNEAWLALTAQEDVATRAVAIRAMSLITICAPGTLFAVSIFGGLLWLASILAKAHPQLLMVVEPPIAPALGLLLAALLYHATELPLASIAVVACFGFLAFTPLHERSHPPEQLGPIFELTLFVLSCVLAVLMCAFLVGLSTPGCQVLPELNAPPQFYGGSTLFLGLCAIVIGLILLAAPCWAMVQRIATPAVVVLACRTFGRGLFVWCMALGIVLTPVAVLLDGYLRNDLQQIVLNEPVYYFNQ
jgi:hypothetical protein